MVDDASIDDTAEVVSRSGARLVRSAANLGPAAARNLALEHAGGELVALLDADDRWEPRFLCYDCHAYASYAYWDPYAYACVRFRRLRSMR